MRYVEWLGKAIAAKLSDSTLGQPLFLRWTLQLSPDHGVLVPLASVAVQTATAWLHARPATLYAQGGVKQGFVSLLLDFEGGQTALIAAETLRSGDPNSLLLLTARHGSLRHDDFPEPVQLGPVDAVARLQRAIEESLSSGRPVALAEAR